MGALKGTRDSHCAGSSFQRGFARWVTATNPRPPLVGEGAGMPTNVSVSKDCWLSTLLPWCAWTQLRRRCAQAVVGRQKRLVLQRSAASEASSSRAGRLEFDAHDTISGQHGPRLTCNAPMALASSVSCLPSGGDGGRGGGALELTPVSRDKANRVGRISEIVSSTVRASGKVRLPFFLT